ncbi:hypothetical protein [Streptomyces sp. NPDC093094]|uniref:hypothetical protein n=1 Tax=Streptomyces sp. NPDC093094 TaxID=3366026 RepID=UPI00382A81C6
MYAQAEQARVQSSVDGALQRIAGTLDRVAERFEAPEPRGRAGLAVTPQGLPAGGRGTWS